MTSIRPAGRVWLDRAIAFAAFLVCSLAVDARAQLRPRVLASGFALPVAFVQDPTNRSVQFVVQQAGRIRVVQAGVVLSTDFLNLTGAVSFGGEQGLLGLAFAPDYSTSGRFFVNFTNPSSDGLSAVRRVLAHPEVRDQPQRLYVIPMGRPYRHAGSG